MIQSPKAGFPESPNSYLSITTRVSIPAFDKGQVMTTENQL